MQFPDFIERKIYLDRIEPFVQKEIMKILVGQRRVGKSYMLYQIMHRLSETDPGGQIIYINKELHEFSEIRTGDRLTRYDSVYGYVCVSFNAFRTIPAILIRFFPAAPRTSPTVRVKSA